MKLIVAGSRQFNDYILLQRVLDTIRPGLDGVKPGETIEEIVSGGANGADKLGERYARQRGYKLKAYPAQWYPNGKFDPEAGKKRNEKMALYADYLVAFDLGTPGTRDMIARMKAKGKPMLIFRKCDGCGEMVPDGELQSILGTTERWCPECIDDQGQAMYAPEDG